MSPLHTYTCIRGQSGSFVAVSWLRVQVVDCLRLVALTALSLTCAGSAIRPHARSSTAYASSLRLPLPFATRPRAACPALPRDWNGAAFVMTPEAWTCSWLSRSGGAPRQPEANHNLESAMLDRTQVAKRAMGGVAHAQPQTVQTSSFSSSITAVSPIGCTHPPFHFSASLAKNVRASATAETPAALTPVRTNISEMIWPTQPRRNVGVRITVGDEDAIFEV